MLADGRHEINATRQRLVAANARELSATNVMDSACKMEASSRRMLKIAMRNSENAKKNVEVAREQLATSREEVIAAETQLKEAEKRWEVIDVDMPLPAAVPPKRRKVTAPPSDARLVVEGCGLSNVNGVYKRDGFEPDDCPIYTRKGRYQEGNNVYEGKYMICHQDEMWQIVFKRYGATLMTHLYINNGFGRNTPPTNGWAARARGGGTLPAPSVRIG